ncbi:MAG: hypothetical protein LBV71_16150 [Prevotella sp.]|jgi:hypothetical protein|nr:hypothetical protein [Prevotella sp.]
MEIVLITEQLLKDNSPISNNVDITDIVPYISIAQKLHINKILGTALLTELEDQIYNNTLTTENSDLIMKIVPALSYWVCYQALPFHWYKWLNKGITTLDSENSNATTMKDMAQLRLYLKDDAQTLTQDLIDFLCECKVNYPLWMPNQDCGCGCDDKDENGQSRLKWDSGINFLNHHSRRGIGNF